MKLSKITVVVLLLLCLSAIFVGCNKTDDIEMIDFEGHNILVPWDEEGSKQPIDYTWEEFEALLPEHQIAFQNTFAGKEFEIWMEKAIENSDREIYPWDEEGAKKPADYTWEEFEALLPEHQIAFQNTFAGKEFEIWMEKVIENSDKEIYPWDEEGAKKPVDYTWEEFQALLPEHQIVFQETFDNFEDFNEWLNANEP